MSSIPLILAASLATASAGSIASSDDGATASEPEIIIVTASPLEDPANRVAQGVGVMLAEDAVPAAISGTLGETLSGLPGVRSTFFGPNASRPVIRGLGEDRIRVLTNGLGSIDASTVSPDHAATADGLEADAIEVLRGPAALRYGGNAIGGVVNVVTGAIPSERLTDTVSGSTFAGFSTAEKSRAFGGNASVGGEGLVLRAEGWSRKNGDFAIPGFLESDRQRALEGEADEDAERGTATNTNGDARMLGAGFAWIGSNIEFGLAVRRQVSNYGVPGHSHGHDEEHEHEDDHGESGSKAVPLIGARMAGAASAADDDGHEHEEEGVRIELEQTRTEARFEVSDLGFLDSLEVSAVQADYEHAEVEPGGEIGTLFTNTGWEGRIEARPVTLDVGSFQLSHLVGLQLGSSDFAARGEEAFVPPVSIEQWGVFAIQRWKRARLTLEAGLRTERREYGTAAADRDFSPVSASVSGTLGLSDGVFLSATVARTQRAPTEIELFADGPHAATVAYEIGNPDLDLETGLSLDLGVRWDLGRFSGEAHVWRIGFDGFSTFLPTGAEEDGLPVYQVIQTDATVQGGELSGRLELLDAAGLTWSATGQVDFVDAQFDSGGAIPRTPPLAVTLGLDARGDGVRGSIAVTRTSDQDEVAAFELPTDGSTVINARLGWKPGGRDGAYEILVEGLNLTDAEVREHTSFLKDLLPRPGRSLRASIRTTF
jgi:iron complex outermembrane recepter protein